MIPVCELDTYKRVDLESWVQSKLMSKTEKALSNDYVNKLYEQYDPQTAKKPIKIALMSDLHLDFDYQEGMSNDCGKPLCCRSDSGKPKSPE